MLRLQPCRRRRDGINWVTIGLLLHVVSICCTLIVIVLGGRQLTKQLGHCRRRKIRCIPALNDVQNRCSNCIRLKKECVFFPVDQQPQPEMKRHGSKAHSGTDKASRSSSPSQIPGQLSQLPEGQPGLPYPVSSMSARPESIGSQDKRERTESFSPDSNKGMLVLFSVLYAIKHLII